MWEFVGIRQKFNTRVFLALCIAYGDINQHFSMAQDEMIQVL